MAYNAVETFPNGATSIQQPQVSGSIRDVPQF